jgi:hypothetical protein
MKQKKPWLLALLVSMLCVCFLSVPAFADGGEEDPWDADDGSGGTNGGDLGDGGGDGVTALLKQSGVVDQNSGGLFSNLFMSITLEVYDYFYGSDLGATQAASQDAKERSRGVNWRSYSGSSVR